MAVLPYRVQILNDLAAGYWRFGDLVGSNPIVDVSPGAAHPLTPNGTLTLGQAGLIGGDSDGAALFDGATAYAATSWNPTWSDFTVEAWISWNGVHNTGSDRIWSHRDTGTGKGAELLVDNAARRIAVYLSVGGTPNTQAAGTLPSGGAHHVAMTRVASTGTVTLFLDGQQQAQWVMDTGALAVPTSMSWGHWVTTGYFGGVLDEAAVYSYCLTGAQLVDHWRAGSSTQQVRVAIGPLPVDVLVDTLAIDDRVEERTTASFTIRDLMGTAHFTYGQSVRVWDSGALIFSGYVSQPKESSYLPAKGLWTTVSCMDQHYLADKRIVSAAFGPQTAGSVVNSLISGNGGQWLALEGVTAGVIQNGKTLTQAIFNYIQIGHALDRLAETSNFTWWIDQDKKLNFISRAGGVIPAPFSVDESMILHGESVESFANQYRNKEYIKTFKAKTGTLTEVQHGDGIKTAFLLGFDVGEKPTSITVNGISKTIGVKQVDSGKDWYYAIGSPVLTQDGSGAVLGAGDTLSVTYKGSYQAVAVTWDQAQINALQAIEGGGSGIVEHAVAERQHTILQSAIDSATAKIAKYGVIGTRINFTVRRAGLRPGQTISVSLPSHQINGSYFIVSVNTHALDAGKVGHVAYDVQCIASPNEGSWAKFFNPDPGADAASDQILEDVDQSTVLVILQSVSETWGWTANEVVTQTAYACPVPAVGLWPSTTLYPC